MALARLTIAASALLTGCRPDNRPTSFSGLVVEMKAASLLQIASFTLRTDDGEIVEVIVEGDVGITPSHLREHMALANPVTVTVRYADGLVIATRVDDRFLTGRLDRIDGIFCFHPVDPVHPV